MALQLGDVVFSRTNPKNLLVVVNLEPELYPEEVEVAHLAELLESRMGEEIITRIYLPPQLVPVMIDGKFKNIRIPLLT